MESSAAPPLPNPGVAKQFMHKNRLQEYAQRSAIPLPTYHTVNEGYSHAPQFRSTVMVDGLVFRSTRTFSHRKEAEQDVANIALDVISKRKEKEGVTLSCEDVVFCKSILHEYAVKMNIEKPTYTTTLLNGSHPVFLSTLVFDGKTYSAGPGKSKKEAEQMAARAVVQSILENSQTMTVMMRIVNSKRKLYSGMHKSLNPSISQDNNLSLKRQAGNDYGSSTAKEYEDQATPLINKFPEQVYPDVSLESYTPQSKKPRKEHICEEQSRAIGNYSSPSIVGDLMPCNWQSVQAHDTQEAIVTSGEKGLKLEP